MLLERAQRMLDEELLQRVLLVNHVGNFLHFERINFGAIGFNFFLYCIYQLRVLLVNGWIRGCYIKALRDHSSAIAAAHRCMMRVVH